VILPQDGAIQPVVLVPFANLQQYDH